MLCPIIAVIHEYSELEKFQLEFSHLQPLPMTLPEQLQVSRQTGNAIEDGKILSRPAAGIRDCRHI